jgi:hypothetical protein
MQMTATRTKQPAAQRSTWPLPATAARWAALIAAQVVAFGLVAWLFVLTRTGQELDWAALSGNEIGRRTAAAPVEHTLSLVSAPSLAAATAVVGLIAALRRRYGAAVA